MNFRNLLTSCAVLALLAGPAGLSSGAPAPKPTRSINVQLTPIGTYASGIYNAGGAEIVAHDPGTHRLFVVNALDASLDVLDISDPTTPTKIGTLNLLPHGGVFNSVAVREGVIAVAVEAPTKTDAGSVVFFGTSLEGDIVALSAVEVGSLPDMLTFTPNGRSVLVANEGEPDSYGQTNILGELISVDPEGTISIIDVSGGAANVTQADVRTVGFAEFNDRRAELQAAGIRIFGPGASVAQDLEPEYIAVSHDSKTAWVTLQENNALAIIDIEAGAATALVGLGLKNHNAVGNALDASDQDGGMINITNWPVFGMYQPDTIAAYQVAGETFLVMANEGDAREYAGLLGGTAVQGEDIRIGNSAYRLDPTVFPDAALLKQNSNLGRLQASRFSGDLNGDGTNDQIHIFGGRSFSIRNASGDLVFDSGDQLEQRTAERFPANFNASNTSNAKDGRSPSKGPEPEGIAIGKAFGRTWAFVGLERIGGVMVYDISDPSNARFSEYVNNRNFAVTPNAANIPPASPSTGDLGPEGLIFISEEESPIGKPLVVVGNEVSGTTTIYEVNRR